jgi:predicted permease
MRSVRASFTRLAGLFNKARRDRELLSELESHLEMHIDDNLRAGMTLEEARRAAMLKLGGVEAAKEAYRDRGTVPLIENLLRDVRFSLRQLRKYPGFAATAIFMLALGMGASVAMFSFVDAALIKPLPYREPSRLVGVYESVPSCPQCNLSYLDYLDWKRLNNVFASFDAYQHTGFSLGTASGLEPVRAARVTDGFFRTLGVKPLLGRDFYSGEDRPGAARAALVSYSTWQKRYGGKRDILGQTVRLDGNPTVIIGVLPPSFHFSPAEPAEFWAALHAAGQCEERRSCHDLFGVARLKDGVSVQAALAGVKTIAQRLEKEYPDSNRGQGASVLPLTDVVVGNIRRLLLVLFSGAVLLLLIACVNIASVMLVRSESRRREIAVRNALGASGARLAGQFVTEGMLLAAAGSAIGLTFAWCSTQALPRLIPENMLARMPYLHGLGLSYRVLAFAALVMAVAAVLFSIIPAFHLSLSRMREGLTEGSRGSAGNTWRRIGPKLVVVELTTAVVLLVGAGLLGKSFYYLLHVDLGLDPDRLTTLQVVAPRTEFAKNEQIVTLGRQVVSNLSNLPGVQSVGISTLLPLSGNGNTTWVRIVGRPYNGEHNEINLRDVSSDYFRTLGAKLVRGRYFNEGDGLSTAGVAIINRAFARQYFPGEDPVGKKIGDTKLSPASIREIVGVVDDIREGALDEAILPSLYYPFNQDPDVYFSLVVRSRQSDPSLVRTLEASVRQIDRGLMIPSAATMSQILHDSPAAYLHRSSAWLVGGFAAAAFLLSVAGLYGVIAYSVSQRTREIGVRIALGAQRGAVYQLILREGGWLSAAGIGAGLACSFAISGLIRGLLFGVQAWDLSILGSAALVLGGAAAIAIYLPARRAASVNPVEALRVE